MPRPENVHKTSVRPLLVLLLLVLLHNAISLFFISFLARTFNFGRRCVLLHMSVINGAIAVLIICLGLSLLSARVREKLFPKILLICLPAASFAILLFLYLGNYITNARWGNNFNYQILGHWQFRHELLGRGIISAQVYVSVALGVAVIFAIYFLMSKTIFRGLAELFLPDHPYSLFANRARARRSLTVISIAAIFFTVCLVALARNVRKVGHLIDEPIIGFFRTESESAGDLERQLIYPELHRQAEAARENYPRGQQFSRKNVIIIIVDSLRDDHMGVYGYQRPTTPFLSNLYAAGRLKRVNVALATCPYTFCGVLSTMASISQRSIIPESFKLYDLLFDEGYRINFVLSGNHTWYGLRDSFGTSVDYYFDGANSARYTANDDRVILEGLEPVAAFSGKPAFFYFHLMSPHYIGFKQDRFRVYEPSQVEGTWAALVSDKYDPIAKTNNYDNSIIQADATIQEIFQSLEQKGYLQNSIVVILGDHGEGLGERGPEYYSHTMTLYQEFLRIPLLIYDTQDASYANLDFATQIDIAPTILDRLGLKIPPSWQGRSLLSPDIKEYSVHETRRNKVPVYAVVERTSSVMYKYIHAADQADELYELVSDPHERNNLIAAADANLITRLKDKLGEYLSHY